MQQPGLTGVGHGQAAIESRTEPEGVVASLVLRRIDQGAQALLQLRRNDRAFTRPVLVGPSCDLERVRRRVGNLAPFLVIRVDPYCLEHPPDCADRALGLVNRNGLADQRAALVVGVRRLPTLDLPRPGEPGQEVRRAACRVGDAPDNVRVKAKVGGRLQGALQLGGVVR
ncbi:hypothetical protein D3C81_1388350 [compost metagenome]